MNSKDQNKHDKFRTIELAQQISCITTDQLTVILQQVAKITIWHLPVHMIYEKAVNC